MSDRSDVNMIRRCARHPGWLESLSAEKRAKVVERLVAVIDNENANPRAQVSAARALAALEKADMERLKLLQLIEPQDPEESEGERG